MAPGSPLCPLKRVVSTPDHVSPGRLSPPRKSRPQPSPGAAVLTPAQLVAAADVLVPAVAKGLG